MRVLVAADKFKDALTAQEACAAIADGLVRARPDWEVDALPLTDGGEGFARILTDAARGKSVPLQVTGPLGKSVPCAFGVVDSARLPTAARERLGLAGGGRLAVIEMAAASGLALLRPEERDVWRTQTRGTGELIAAAADLGADGILLGVGGSATNDFGLGALAALGAILEDAAGRPVAGEAPVFWEQIVRVNLEKLRALPPIWIACDVTNPLLGPCGAAAVYGRQKGLAAEALPRLEAAGARLAALLDKSGKLDAVPGAGAAGGIAFGLMAGAGARLVPGFELVSDWLRAGQRLAGADLVITGEGRFDESSAQGKGPGSLVRAALALGKPVHVFAGRVDAAESPGLRLHEITPRDIALERALAEAGRRLREQVEVAFAR